MFLLVDVIKAETVVIGSRMFSRWLTGK